MIPTKEPESSEPGLKPHGQNVAPLVSVPTDRNSQALSLKTSGSNGYMNAVVWAKAASLWFSGYMLVFMGHYTLGIGPKAVPPVDP